MSKGADKVVTLESAAPAVLMAAAFVSPGAWMLTDLPPPPVAKTLHLMTAGVWLLAFGVGFVASAKLDRRVLYALFALVVSVGASFLVGGSLLPVAVYDLYGNMSLLQWMAFPLVFALAAGLAYRREQLELGLAAVVLIGTLIAAIMVFQQLSFGFARVFGTTAYSVTALVPLVPIAVVLAASARGSAKLAWYSSAAIISIALAVFSGAITGVIAAGFALVLSAAIHPSLRSGGAVGRLLSRALVAVSCVVLLVSIWAQIPGLSGGWIDPESLVARDPNLASRAYLWKGAQDMLAERPVLGFGPSGYRVAAAEHLAPEALQLGSDAAPGSIDPTVYSPQSPHSLLWEIATRLGVLGLLAFAALLGAWVAVLRGRVRGPDVACDLRLALAAGFVCALLALMVNPVVFPIGLFAAAAAGLAIAPATGSRAQATRPVGRRRTAVFSAAGVALMVAAVWLGVGEWRAHVAGSDNPYVTIGQLESALRVIPGHPPTERRLLETRLLVAANDAEVRAVQQAADAAPGHLMDFAPNSVSLVAFSLVQAERTGRADLSWERGLLDHAADRIPQVPSLVAERLHLAVVSGDPEAVRAAIPAAETWGRPYLFTESYLTRAEEILAVSPP